MSALPVAPPAGSGIAYVDGAFVPMEQATISVLDYGFTRSDVTYDVVHVWSGGFFRLDHHLDRFLRSLGELRMDIGMDRAGLRRVLIECVRRTGLREAYVAMLCTRGRPPVGSRDLRLARNRFIAYAIPFVWIGGREGQKDGLSAVIGSFRRIPPESVDPTVKNYHWLDMERGQFEAYDRGADTAILLGMDGNVTEGPGFNVFAVFGERIATPDRGVLEGITRQTVIDICRERGLPLDVGPIPGERFREADEIFLTSTAGGIVPLVRLDDRILYNGVPGPTTLRVRDLYWQRHDDPSERTPIDYGA
ncbi:MAG: aminotransferase class IV [Alphaproteobacteria bacterium]|nr:aminotransferase class IV [Alphaproteobacteria bacterium]